MDKKYITAGQKLRELRKKTKMSIFKVAKKVHISGNYMSLLERGINNPSDEVLFNLAEFYEIDPSELFTLYDRVPPPTNEQLKRMPSLRKIVTELSIDPKLSAQEKEQITNQLYEIANSLINKEA